MIGDKVACCKRYTVEAPIPGNPAYRKDINLGTQGILLAWAADDHSKAQVQVDLEVPRVYKEKVSGKKVIKHTHVTSSRNLLRLDKYLAAHADDSDDTESSDEDDGAGGKKLTPRNHAWLNDHLDEDERTKVTLLGKWAHLVELHDHGDAMQTAFCKSASVTMMRLALEELPPLDNDDLLVCEREIRNPRLGGATSVREVWTKKAFQPGALCLAPVTSSLMDRLWTAKRAASIDVPAAGPFSYPKKRTLAMDGRLDGDIGVEGSGNIFWTIQRTEDRRQANLILEQVEVSLSCRVNLPRRKRTCTMWAADELPCPRFLVNPLKIEQHTRLVALEDKIVRAAADKDKAAKKAG